MKASEISEIISSGEFGYYGIRKDDMQYKVGGVCDNSHSWTEYDPEDGSEVVDGMGLWDNGELDGTCAIGVTADTIKSVMEQSKEYYGKNLYLIASNSKEMGEDAGEYIMSDAVVLAIIK